MTTVVHPWLYGRFTAQVAPDLLKALAIPLGTTVRRSEVY